MVLIDFLLFLVIGCGVGFLAGLFGVGGGIVMVPILILTYQHYGFSPSVLTHMAIGTSLFVVVFASIASAYQQKKQNNIDWRMAYFIGFSSVLTAFGTSRLAAELSGKHLQVAFALIVIIAAIRMLTESKIKAEKKLILTSKPNSAGLVVVGLTAGVVSALTGIGGGVYIIPILYYFSNVPLKLAIGTSSASIVITGLFSLVGYIVNGLGRPGLAEWSLGFVDLERGIALAIGSIFLARVGARVSFITNPYHLRRLFAVFVIIISLYIALQ